MLIKYNKDVKYGIQYGKYIIIQSIFSLYYFFNSLNTLIILSTLLSNNINVILC